MIINHEKKFIFTSVPKTGSTSIMTQLDASKLAQPPEEYHAPLPGGYDDYFKFGFVRNPLDRFISTYIDGINDHGHLLVWSKRLTLYKTFKDFCMGFKDEPLNDDVHFRPQHTFFYNGDKCLADAIYRYEEFAEGCEAASKQIGINLDSRVRIRQTNRLRDYKLYFDPESMAAIIEFYEEDFNIFGYDMLIT